MCVIVRVQTWALGEVAFGQVIGSAEAGTVVNLLTLRYHRCAIHQRRLPGVPGAHSNLDLSVEMDRIEGAVDVSWLASLTVGLTRRGRAHAT
jgi:hypothetical protein